MKAFAISAKLKINVHDLNNELSAGNVSDIRQIDMLTCEGEIISCPAVSGRMLKHYHKEHFRQYLLERYPQTAFSPSAKAGEPIWPAEWGVPKKKGDKKEQSKEKEGGKECWILWTEDKEPVKNCAVSDVHGYLAAIGGAKKDKKSKKTEETEKESEIGEEAAEGEEKDVESGGSRRTSRVMFSWLLPVLDHPEYGHRQVIHARVATSGDVKYYDGNKENPVQMPFNKSYASDFYAFVSYLWVDGIGWHDAKNAYLVDEPERKHRKEAALLAYLHMLSGKTGASLSHALPHVDVISVLVAYSKETQFPVPVSPIYPDYISKTIGMMPKGVKLLGYGEAGESDGVKKYDKLIDLFNDLLGEL